MKNQNVLVALIIAVALLTSSFIVWAGFISFGRSMEKAASSVCHGMAAQRPAVIPDRIRLDLGEIQLKNGGGGGESVRFEVTNIQK